MRISRTFTIEEELVKKLQQEENQSNTINQVLNSHYKKLAFEGLTKKQLTKELEIIKLEEKIKKLKDGE